MASAPPAAGFNFNNIEAIRSHSSALYNERMAILFYWLDVRSIEMNKSYAIPSILEVRATIKQLYKNMRSLIRNNPTMRATLNLETKEDGIYVTDVAIGNIDNMILWSEMNGYTLRNIHIIIQELNRVELLIKDVMQYFHYFIRPDFRQKPDVELATEQYKFIADSKSVDELRAIIGKNAKVDLDNIGSTMLQIDKEVAKDVDEEIVDEEPDPVVDGEI